MCPVELWGEVAVQRTQPHMSCVAGVFLGYCTGSLYCHWVSLFIPILLQEGFAPPEDDELEEQHPEEQDEY